MDVMTALHNYRGLVPKLEKFGESSQFPGDEDKDFIFYLLELLLLLLLSLFVVIIVFAPFF